MPFVNVAAVIEQYKNGQANMFVCPSNEAFDTGGDKSYITHGRVAGFVREDGTPYAGSLTPRRLDDVKQQSATPLVFEAYVRQRMDDSFRDAATMLLEYPNTDPTNAGYRQPHLNQTHQVMFIDGHVSGEKIQDWQADWFDLNWLY